VNRPDPYEDLIYGCAAAVWVVACLVGLVVLLSGHGVIPPDPPTHQATTASPTP